MSGEGDPDPAEESERVTGCGAGIRDTEDERFVVATHDAPSSKAEGNDISASYGPAPVEDKTVHVLPREICLVCTDLVGHVVTDVQVAAHDGADVDDITQGR